jgi:hypothetical protein
VVERHSDDYQPDEDSKGKPFAPIYIRNKSLTPTEVTILTTLVFTFGLLICITAFDIYFLDMSYGCTDDRRFRCFVLPGNIYTNKSELGITNKRISNCSQWENTNISDQVYVICYKWVYNFKGVTVAVGALLTVFKVTIKATISIFISLNAYLHENDYFTVTKDKLKRIRRVLAGIVFGIELTILAIVTSFICGGFERYIMIEHGNQVVLIFGIITTCLLLPIEEYIEDQTQQIPTENEFSADGRYLTSYGSNELT